MDSKCKLCGKPALTWVELKRDWPEPKPQFAWGEKETIGECWLCPDHNWRVTDLNMGARRSLLAFRIKVNKGADSFPAEISVHIGTLLIPDEKDGTTTTIHRIPKGEHLEVNHIGYESDASGEQ